MKFATPWSRPDVPGLVCPPPEKTEVQQHFKDECDINNILRRIKGGADPAILQERKGFYADLTNLPVQSLGDAFEAVNTAYNAFDSLPSEFRSMFNNDPQEFISFVDKHGPDSLAPLFGEKAVPTEPASIDATNNDATNNDGETA